MSQITLPAETASQLAEAEHMVELHDANGQLLGVFEPGLSQADIEFFDFICEKGWSGSFAEYRQGILEGRRAMRDPNYAKDWKTTQQILDKLKSLS
jgi:hypothetical protein